ncbi:MAG TPA: hypothetical protein VNS19_11095 [Acidimicrobiales bacterium]|nr:hypothetical protein [Acidimicrobiales bacterium]
MSAPLGLRADVADGLAGTWVIELIDEVASELGWSVSPSGRPDAVAVVVPLGTAIAPADEPLIAVRVEAGTPRSPAVEESPPHLPARLDLTVGAFRARRNQRVTRDALERFFARVERTRPEPLVDGDGPDDALDPAEAVARADAAAIVAENRDLLAAVDAWLARTSMTPDAAQAIHADRTILEAAIGAPVLDLVIVERTAARLATAITP